MLKTWQYLWWAGSLWVVPRTCLHLTSHEWLFSTGPWSWRCTVSSLVWVLYLKGGDTYMWLPSLICGFHFPLLLIIMSENMFRGRGQLERVLLIWDQFSVGPVEGRSTWSWMSFWFPPQLFSEHYFAKETWKGLPLCGGGLFSFLWFSVLCTRSPFHSNTISLLCCVSNKSPMTTYQSIRGLLRHVPIPEVHWCPYAFLWVGEIQMNLLQQGCFSSVTCLAYLLVMVSFPSPEKRFLMESPSLWKLGSILPELHRTVYFSLERGQLIFIEGSTSSDVCLFIYDGQC